MSLSIPPRYAPPMKAGPTGSGAGVLMTEYSLNTLMHKTPQAKMRQAWQLGISVPWIRSAERVITGNCSTVDWHLEDENDETVDDDYTGPLAQSARTLIEKPQATLTVGKKLTRRELWALTFRHMGLCGNSFWFLDAMNAYGIPANILYVRPDRMTPVDDDAGNLIGWVLDRDPSRNNRGIPIDMDEVIQFVLDPPDEGHFGIGLVESAMLKAQLSTAVDQHMATVLSGGGRLSGFLAPKDGAMSEPNYEQLVRDFRTVVEQPDAAKRLQVLRGPVDFTATTLSPAELHIRDLMTGSRDDLLALWGVPLSQIGGYSPTGLNSGDTRKYDEAALWQNANHPRIVAFREPIQGQLLDKYVEAGAVVELEIDEPEFDDDSPRYDLLLKSAGSPLRNSERRELIGLPPFGPLVIGVSGLPLDDEVWLPVTQVQAYTANEDAAQTAPTPTEEALGRSAATADDNAAAGDAAGETSQGAGGVTKAKLSSKQAPLHASLVKLRTNVAKTATPKLQGAVGTVLQAQRREIAERIRKHAAAVTVAPKDTSVWFDGAKWDKALGSAMKPHLAGMAQSVNEHIASVLAPIEGKAGPVGAVERAMTRGAARVTKINETTRLKIQEALARAIDEGMTAQDAADVIEGIGATTLGGLDLGALFDEYRSEMIARTELMDAYNSTAIASYGDAGIEEVQAIDGDGDEECAARDGETFSMDEADGIEDHPNGTLDWVPILA